MLITEVAIFGFGDGVGVAVHPSDRLPQINWVPKLWSEELSLLYSVH